MKREAGLTQETNQKTKSPRLRGLRQQVVWGTQQFRSEEVPVLNGEKRKPIPREGSGVKQEICRGAEPGGHWGRHSRHRENVRGKGPPWA